MYLRDIFKGKKADVFVVIDQFSDINEDCFIEITNLKSIPERDGFYFVKAIQYIGTEYSNCYLGVSTPERIFDYVITEYNNGDIYISEEIESGNVIPLIPSECFGIYEDYYLKANPLIGIDVLKKGIKDAMILNKSVIAEDLGYILRDEGDVSGAIEAFEISEKYGVSSNFIFFELSKLYGLQGCIDKQKEYDEKFKLNNITPLI